ncbi:Maf family nucleotide pyrophosphatase [Brevibacterium sp. 50QC2O2]|uniref:Maf family protein n=1 Tax=Brevibacterium sp. 50QC2O2 TaxID=2968459 RepID=UPI00211C665A|nr:nucleoside triphosphate pyrophosphatase [Brevibacterium sp. 50QC2O2]MCQ9387421.1 Maf family nucleotide pyrophosphatase [Brevibacterium sp. 50QC2O2]
MNRVVLASSSPTRQAILRAAGITPLILVPDVDEDAVTAAESPGSVAEQVQILADAKSAAVLERLIADPRPVSTAPGDVLAVIAADSLLELDGRPIGKPHTAQRAREVWHAMAGRTTHLHTGHVLTRLESGPTGLQRIGTQRATSTTTVHIGRITDAELEAYIATGEPLEVAGALTIDGYGGAFVDSLEGDHLGVLGLSLPTLRRMSAALDLAWTSLWDTPGS